MTSLEPDVASVPPASEPAPSAGWKLNTFALILGVIVFGLLAYGVIETAIKATALFTG